MNKKALERLVDEANVHSEFAAAAIESGRFEAAQDEMRALSVKYQAFCAVQAKEAVEEIKADARHEVSKGQASTDEAAKQQQDDEQHEESTEEKG